MRAYISAFRIRLINNMQYRSAALAGVATQFFWGFIYIMIFQAFFKTATSDMPMNLNQTISYIWLQQAFLAFIMFWFRDMQLFNLITEGNIAYELTRPINIYGFWFTKLLAGRFASGLLRCFPILIFAFIIPYPYKMSIPDSITTLLCFLVALILGLFIVVAISMLIYISVFITMSPYGSLVLIGTIGEFCSGMVIPLPFMPEWLQKIIYYLPFRLTADFPFRIYNQNISTTEAITGIGMQLLWLFILIIIGNYFMNRVQKHVVIQGG